jgi:hypothetical protein
MDAVQEFTVQQNAVDAEFGHSAGGTISLSMKSGTNEYHGTAYYFGRNPALNAVANSVTRRENLSRNHIAGGTVGGPILKNKLFNFVSYEWWKTPQALSTILTLPTELERAGDFSRSLTTTGAVRVIYDPWTTQLDSAGRVTRTPFAGNVIPASRIDPTSKRVLQDLWLPNGPGDDLTGLNNFKKGFPRYHRYWNFSDRADWNINDKWKVFGRYSRFINDYQPENYANSPAVPVNGGIMASRSIAIDSVYTLSPATVVNARFGYTNLVDDLDTPSTELTEEQLASFWPGNSWYKPYTANIETLYYPQVTMVGGSSFGRGAPWVQRASSYSYHGKVSHSRGIHQFKGGFEHRRASGLQHNPYPFRFDFSPVQTADTYIAPDTRLRGNAFATFLLGALEGSSQSQFVSPLDLRANFYGAYFQDDIRLTRSITLNLGLRYEVETGIRDTEDRVSRYLDLSSPIPEMQAQPPVIPPSVTSIQTEPYKFNGAWVFTDSGNRNAYTTPRDRFMPRAGIAVRLNDKTALRVGYSRFVLPAEVMSSSFDPLPTYGFNAATNVEPVLQGVPGARLNNPFPASNPLILPVGKAYGRYTNLGDNANWIGPELVTGINDRFNFSIQRQLPSEIVLDATFFANYGHGHAYTRQLNMMDPALSYRYKADLSRSIPNPFYQYLTPDKFPGQLRNRANVTVASLLVPYPQYLTLSRNLVSGVHDRYRALQLRLQRSSARGYTFLWAYNYNRQKTEAFFNSDDTYADRLTYQTSNNPRHRMTLAGTYELPFGKGQRMLNSLHPVVNGVLGGWSLSGIYSFSSGQFVRFGQAIIEGSPAIDNPTRDRWWDTSKFTRPEPFTPRVNPWQYAGVTGPSNWSADLTLAKFFPITERVRIEFRMEAYNVTNSFIPSAPIADVLNTAFGRSTNQGNLGRELQYTARLHF